MFLRDTESFLILSRLSKDLGWVHTFLVMERHASHLTVFSYTPTTPAEIFAHYTHTHTTRPKHDVRKPRCLKDYVT